MKSRIFTIVGGDLRQAHLANTLAGRESGYTIYGMFLEKGIKLSGKILKSADVKLVMPQSDILIFPLPMLGVDGMINTPLSECNVTLEECLDYILPDSVVLAGMVPCPVHEAARERGIEIIDYYEREEFIVLNAVPTALSKRLSRIRIKSSL